METFGSDGNESETLESTGAGLMPPPESRRCNNQGGEEQGSNDATKEPREDAPWSVDWTTLAAERLKEALEAYKDHAKGLFEAISTFVDESNAIHAEWHDLHQAELAESQRLDEVEPDVYHATMGGEQIYGVGFPGEDPDSTGRRK